MFYIIHSINYRRFPGSTSKKKLYDSIVLVGISTSAAVCALSTVNWALLYWRGVTSLQSVILL